MITARLTKKRLAFFGAWAVIVIAGVWLVLRWRQPARNVILISIDTCRADRLSCYDFIRRTTPNIDAIAKESILFKNALSPIPLTLPAHSSMLTGTYPPYHQVHDNLNYQLGESNVTIAEILRAHGYTTGAVISTFVLDRRFGTAQGFDSYNDRFTESTKPSELSERRADDASRLACSYLEQHKNEPFFLFLHYYDPHFPYEPPEPFASGYMTMPYVGEIAYTDHCIGQVIEKLKSLGLYDSTLLIIVGDHGESLGEYGEAAHGYFIYQSTVRVPFIIRPSGGYRKPKIINDAVSLVDVVPTILSYLKIPVPAYMQGKDLSVYFRRKPPTDPKRHVYIESLTATKYGCNPLLGLVTERWKYIETTRPELYDLHQRPFEANNLMEKEGKRAQLMQGQLQEVIAQLTSGESADSTLELDEESIKRLESLGYVGGESINDTFTFDRTKTDPKDLIQYYEYTQKVTYQVFYKKYDEAFATCEKMLAEWPEIPNTYFILTQVASAAGELTKTIEYGSRYLTLTRRTIEGDSESFGLDPSQPIAMAHNLVAKAAYELGKYELATEHWTTAMRLVKSDWPEVLNELGAASFQLGKIDEAVECWNKALQLQSDWPEVHNNLAGAFYKQGKIDEAIVHWTEALRLKPGWTEVRSNLNKLIKRNKQEENIARYSEMLRRNPDDPNTHQALATELYRQGKIDEAIAHWLEAAKQKPDWAEVQNSLGTAFYQQSKPKDAVKYWSEAIRLKPDWPEPQNNLAWLLATAEDEKLHNPAEAVRLAERACELSDYNQPGMLDTLGVTYAAAGRFTEAVKTAEKGIELAQQTKQETLAEDIQSRLELYKTNKPYHD